MLSRYAQRAASALVGDGLVIRRGNDAGTVELEPAGSKCAIHYILPARLVPRLRVTSPQPPSFWQRIAAAQERDECPSGLLPNNSPNFATTRND